LTADSRYQRNRQNPSADSIDQFFFTAGEASQSTETRIPQNKQMLKF